MDFLKKLNKKYLILLLPICLLFFNTSVTANQFPSATNLSELKKLMAESISRDIYSFTIIYEGSLEPISSNDGLSTLFEEASALAGPFYEYQLRQSGVNVGNVSSLISLTFNMSYENTIDQIDEIDAYVKRESDRILATTSNKAEVVKKLNDFLKSTVTYGNSSANSYSAYGIVKENSANNMGFAFITERFFDYLKYESDIVKGIVNGSSTYWNMVKLDGVWYHIDIAENDRTSSDSYLLKSDTSMSLSRSWDYSSYEKANTDYDFSVPFEPSNPVPTTPAGDPSASASGWARVPVKEAIDSGFVPLSLQSRYQESITREEFCELVVSLYEKISRYDATYSSNPFTDTTSEAVLKASSLGIVSGVGGGKFAPNNLITREQIAVMFNNLLTSLDVYPFVDSKYIMFVDESEISGWAKEAVQILFKLNIMNGVGSNRINPKGNATIEQAIILGGKLYNQYK